MKVKVCVTLTREELDKISDALDILDNYHAAMIINNGSDKDLEEIVSQTTSALDTFLCEYEDKYEE